VSVKVNETAVRSSPRAAGGEGAAAVA
jgi:hypothetical protein